MSQNLLSAATIAATPQPPLFAEAPEDLTLESEKQTPFTRITIDPSSPLAKLSELFPQGVLSFESFPTLHLGPWECFELLWPPGINAADLAIALFQPDVPPEICCAWLELQVLVVPEQWVRTESPH